MLAVRTNPCTCGGEAGGVTAAEAECVFCEIVGGRLPSSCVYDDDRVVAFMDIQPVTAGHVLVVPKQHVAYLENLEAELGAAMFRVAHRLARSFSRSGLPCEGVNLFLAEGEAAFQEVFHTHLHVFPRYDGDTFRIEADWRTQELDELEAAAAKVRSGMRLLDQESARGHF
jgi:histidine triad (HIT) family protein